MAGALAATSIPEAAGQVAVFGREQARAFESDPYAYTARLANRVGAASFFVGLLAWLGGGYLSAQAKAAAADEASVAGSVAGVFSNAASVQAAITNWVDNALAAVKFTTISELHAGELDVSAFANQTSDIGENDTGKISSVTLTVVGADGKTPVVNSAGVKLDHVVLVNPTEPDLTGAEARTIGPWYKYQQVFNGLVDGTEYGVILTVTFLDGRTVTGSFKTAILGSSGVWVSVYGYDAANNATLSMDLGSGSGMVGITGTDPTVQQAVIPTGPQAVPTNPIGAALGGLAGAAVAATDLPKAVLVLGMSVPRLLYDGVVAVLGGGLGSLLTAIGPPLVFFGILMMLLAWFLRNYARRLASRLELAANARTARWWNRFDKWWKTRRKVQEVWTQKSTEGLVHSANANPEFVPPVEKAQDVVVPSPPVAQLAPLTEGQEKGPGISPPGPGNAPEPGPPPAAPTIPTPEAPGPQPSPENAPAAVSEPPVVRPPSDKPEPGPSGPQPGDVVPPEQQVHSEAPPGALPAEVAQVDVRRAPVRRRRHETRLTGDQILALAERRSKMFPEDAAAADQNDERLKYAANEGEAREIAEEKTTVIKTAEAQRRVAKVEADHFEKANRKGRVRRGFMEGSDPRDFGAYGT